MNPYNFDFSELMNFFPQHLIQQQQQAPAQAPLQAPSFQPRPVPQIEQPNFSPQPEVNPFDQVRAIGEDRLDRLDNSGAFGGIRQSPHNRGGRLNNPLGAPPMGEPYLRSPEEVRQNIQSRQQNFSGPEAAQAGAAAVAQRKAQQGPPEWTPAPGDHFGGVPFITQNMQQPQQQQQAPQPSAPQYSDSENSYKSIVESTLQQMVDQGLDPTDRVDEAIDEGVLTLDEGEQFILAHQADKAPTPEPQAVQSSQPTSPPAQAPAPTQAPQTPAPIVPNIPQTDQRFVNPFEDGIGLIPGALNNSMQGSASIIDQLSRFLLGDSAGLVPRANNYTANLLR